MTLPVNQIMLGNVLDVLKELPDESVHCCVTSPPYWGLRDYEVEGQLGLEETPEEYVEKLVLVFREVRRVLRRDGIFWLNLGDSYVGTGHKGDWKDPKNVEGRNGQSVALNNKVAGLKSKDLVGIPWRVAFALQADGWYLRSDIIWHKPNAMPESVTDRPTKAHEYIFLLSKSEKYYYDQDAIREPYTDVKNGSSATFQREDSKRGVAVDPKNTYATHRQDRVDNVYGHGGRNKRSVWTVATKPYKEAHFAVFPPELIEPCILAGTSGHGCCSSCGASYARITKKGDPILHAWSAKGAGQYNIDDGGMRRTGLESGSTLKHIVPIQTIGWEPTCSCNAGVSPCILLDPFFGSGTTGFVALQNRRNYIGIELNPKYVKIAKKRLFIVQRKII